MLTLTKNAMAGGDVGTDSGDVEASKESVICLQF